MLNYFKVSLGAPAKVQLALSRKSLSASKGQFYAKGPAKILTGNHLADYAVAVRPARSALTCHSRAATVVS